MLGQGSLQVTGSAECIFFHAVLLHFSTMNVYQDDEAHPNCLTCGSPCELVASELKLCPDFSSSCHLASRSR